ncbi:MAG: carboxypeptidase regulatory-like domain-containing protein [Nitrospirota bacterium]
MKITSKLLLIAAYFALAISLMFTGNAGAKYMSDGAVPDGSGGWITPNDMVCIVGVHADGTLDVADGVTNARDCIYLQTGTMNGGTPFNLTGMINQNDCTKTGLAGNDGAKHSWATTFCTLPLTGLDRTQKMCEGIGGTWITTGKCVAHSRQFRGQDANGTPLAFGSGSEGTDASQNAGFCYTKMRTGIAVAICPSTTGQTWGTGTATSIDAFGYPTSATAPANCTYDYGVNGAIDTALTKTDGTTYPAGTSLNLSTLGATMGDCLANGASWANWIPAGTTAAIGSIIGMTFDLTRQAAYVTEGCLHCHSSVTQYNGPAERWKDSYLLTGHKNMLRKVTPGHEWAGPDGVVYTGAAYGQTLDFLNAQATGSYGTLPLLYIFGDWMAPAPAALYTVIQKAGSVAKYNGGTGDYSCAPCHAVGWSNTDPTKGICTLSSKTTELACTGAGGTWTPLTGVQAIGTPGYAAKQPGDSFPGVNFGTAGQWDVDGIQCSRCHNATVPSVTAAQIAASAFPQTFSTTSHHGNTPAGPSGAWATKLCFSCHQSIAKELNGTGANADLNHPEAIPVKNAATSPAYVPEFSGHVLGGSFLNSPHGQFTGTITPNSLGKYDIVDGGTYASTFKGYTCWQSSTSNSPAKTKADGTEIKDKATCEGLYGAGAWRPDTQGNCTTCHDIHQSLFVAGQEGLRKECNNCHENAEYAADVPAANQVNAATVHHRKTSNTPFDTSLYVNACEVCHMPKATSRGFPMHLWRINTDPAYSTFPTAAEFGIGAAATLKNGRAAADGTYANAVWVDLDYACGQCHGGGSNSTDNPPKPGSPWFPKSVLAMFAGGMHNPDLAPVAGAACVWTANTWTMDVTNTSTDDGPDADMLPGDGDALLQIDVDWGDGSAKSYGSAGTAFNHVYSATGTFTVSLTATDSNLQTNTTTCTTQATPAYFSISGIVKKSIAQDSENLNNATIQLLNSSNVVIKSVSTRPSGTFSFGSLKPGTYKIKAVKTGFTFPAATTIVVGPSSAGNVIQALTPPRNQK